MLYARCLALIVILALASCASKPEVILYYETGKTQEIRRYNKGRLNGVREFYDANGILERTETYELGNKINK